MKSIEDFIMYLKLTLEVRSDFQQAVEKGISKMILAPSDLIYARSFIPESLSTERRQLSKVETDLEDKIINLFNGTSSSALCVFSCCVFPFVGHRWQRYTFLFCLAIGLANLALSRCFDLTWMQ